MARVKQKRGLPDSYGLDVPESATEAPIQIGDYLDDDEYTQVPVDSPRQTIADREDEPTVVAPQKVVSMPQTAEQRPVIEPRVVTKQPPQPVSRRVSKSPPKRKQINMKPETLRKSEELLGYIQTYSGQADAKASEMFDAIVSLLHDAKEHLDLSSIAPRGKWGTPTARAFPTNLKNAFEQAVIVNYQTKQE